MATTATITRQRGDRFNVRYDFDSGEPLVTRNLRIAGGQTAQQLADARIPAMEDSRARQDVLDDSETGSVPKAQRREHWWKRIFNAMKRPNPIEADPEAMKKARSSKFRADTHAQVAGWVGWTTPRTRNARDNHLNPFLDALDNIDHGFPRFDDVENPT